MKITLNNISKSFGKKTVISGLSLELADGKFTTLLGSSGCGKTTLLRMIAGLETPDDGEILFDDEVVFSKERSVNAAPEKRNLSFVFQDFALWPHMTVFENVAFGLRARKQKEDLKQKVYEALETVKLGDFAGRYPHELSGGQQQRVAFARAIVVKPRCILFDEPLSALDAKLRESMRAEIKELTQKLNITSVFVTHDQTEAMSMSDYIVVMNGGKIEQYGTPITIYEKPATKFVAEFVGKANWTGENTMVRPEAVTLGGDKSALKGRVISSQYSGGKYLLNIDVHGEKWAADSVRRYDVGDEVNVSYDSDEDIAIYYPESGTVINPRPAMIMNTAPHVDNAKVFIDYLMSDEAQSPVADAYLIPGRDDVDCNSARLGYDDIKQYEVDWEKMMAVADEAAAYVVTQTAGNI